MILLFIFLNLINVSFFLTKKYKLFLFASLLIIFIEPIFQKLVDPTLYGETYNVFGFDRVKTNLIIIISFIYILIKQRRVLLPDKISFPINFYIFIFFVFHVFNVLFSENIGNSTVIAIVSIIGPILFFYILTGLPEKIFTSNASLLNIIYFSVICFLLIGILMYNNTSIKSGSVSDIAINRTGGGLWLSNISTQLLAMLFPFTFSKIKFTFSKTIRTVVILLFLVLLIISMSRTGLIVYFIMLLMIFKGSRNKILYILLSIPVMFVLLNLAQRFFNIDIVDLYAQRFFQEGNAISTAESDSRFEIYKEGFEIVKGSEIFGTGISTFSDLNRLGFSNAHNIFINIYVERGIIGLLLILILFYYILKSNRRLNKEFIGLDEESQFFKFFQIGIIGFLLIGLTGNDMFVNSGFVNGWATYILIFLLAIRIKKQIYFNKLKQNVI